jgi:3-methyladenine DNA glycosylase AlkC
VPFADELINGWTAESLTRAIRTAAPDAPLTALRAAGARLEGLALRERADVLRDALLEDLPGDYAQFARVLRSARDTAPSFSGWLIWPVTSAAATKAVADGSDTAFDDAMSLMAELTGRLTAEFAIRTLLRHNLDRALDIVTGWTQSDDLDVRRLASEGTRSYLPWSVRVPELIARPGVTVSVLDALYQDPSEYVRRSVANHLNDLSRDHASLVVDTARRWSERPDANTASVIRHGLRTLVKRGDAGALSVLGFSADNASIEVDGPRLNRTRVPAGEAVELHATIRNVGDADARLAIDYIVHHRRANGGQTTKTFKLTTATLKPGQSVEARRSHSFRPISTRRYYPGEHAISLQINGVATSPETFELLPPT